MDVTTLPLPKIRLFLQVAVNVNNPSTLFSVWNIVGRRSEGEYQCWTRLEKGGRKKERKKEKQAKEVDRRLKSIRNSNVSILDEERKRRIRTGREEEKKRSGRGRCRGSLPRSWLKQEREGVEGGRWGEFEKPSKI